MTFEGIFGQGFCLKVPFSYGLDEFLDDLQVSSGMTWKGSGLRLTGENLLITLLITRKSFVTLHSIALFMKKLLIFALSAFFCCSAVSNAQSFVMKTNLLHWASTTPNIGLEFSIGEKWTLGLDCGYNPWELNPEKNTKLKHLVVSPEFRYWFCETFHGHFLGIDAGYSIFNIAGMPVPAAFYQVETDRYFIDHLKNSRSEGWAASAGLVYGCSWPISRCWNFEAKVGLGVWYSKYDRYETRPCGLFNDTVSKFVFGPTSLGLSFVYIIK